jgi:hypothetical protein
VFKLTQNNKFHFCTHFSSAYIPQGVALILSIKKCYPDSIIWIMPLDEMTKLTLTELRIEKVYILDSGVASELFSNFHKFCSTRNFAEAVFSIKPQFIEYVLHNSQEKEITFYLDADTFLFAPFELPVDSEEPSIFLSPHYFTPMSSHSAKSGKYNAGLVGFRNDTSGREAARFWSALCEEWFFVVPDSGRYADQKYLEVLATQWSAEVAILSYGNNFGTWSFAENMQIVSKNGNIYIDEKLITSFHFHGLKISRILLRTGISMYGYFSNHRKIKKLVYTRYRLGLNSALVLLSRIESDGTYENRNLIPKVGGLRNFLALVRRRDFMFMTSGLQFRRKHN